MSEASAATIGEMDVQIRWRIKIPMRDGIQLSATLYLREGEPAPSPVIFTLTPYMGQTFHHFAVYFAERGVPFLTIDVRGRGESEGEFRPNIQEARDGCDVVEWIARQPYCNGKVAMWGGSYAGYSQWASAKENPEHLATIVPVASPYIGIDFPMRRNMFSCYIVQWLTYVSGRTAQEKIFWDSPRFWTRKFVQWYESGAQFINLDDRVGTPSAIFQEWVSHPEQSEYWDRYNPTPEEYSRLRIPILTITGSYDGNQPGALKHYREHTKYAPAQFREGHYLVIGPWDHAGTRLPRAEFGGIKVGAESLLDLQQLHLQWYAWTMQGGEKPAFLKKRVAYYVIGAEKWRYADTLEEVTDHLDAYYLSAFTDPTDVFLSGVLSADASGNTGPSRYVYDPKDVSGAAFEASIGWSYTDQQLIYRSIGKQLIYHSKPFERDTEISGFFKLRAWLSIDQPDTDFDVTVYAVEIDGISVWLSSDSIRARYRESPRKEKLISTTDPLPYDFDQFTFISRVMRRGSRLRLVIGPVSSMYAQRNFNSGGIISRESIEDARAVNVALFHDSEHPSLLHVPVGRCYSSDEPTAPASAFTAATHVSAGGTTCA